MIWNDSPRIASIQQTVEILHQVIDKLDQDDPASAQVMVGVAIHLLEGLNLDLNHHLDTRRSLQKASTNS
jgi:hypothetical protein